MHVHLFLRREWWPTNNHHHNFTVQILTCDLQEEFSVILLKEGGISRTFLIRSVKFRDCLRFLPPYSIKLFIIIDKWSSLVILRLQTNILSTENGYGECILFFIQLQLNIDKYWNYYSTNLIDMIIRYSSFQPAINNLQYALSVKPSFEEFILPSKKYADVIIPRGGDNDVAIDLIIQHIRAKLGQHHLCNIYPNVSVIHSTFQVILFNLICCCNFFSSLSVTLLFVKKLCVCQIFWFEISVLEYERKQIIIFSSSFHPDAGNAHTCTWCQDNEAWLCLLCRPTNTLGRYLSLKRNFRDINWGFLLDTA